MAFKFHDIIILYIPISLFKHNTKYAFTNYKFTTIDSKIIPFRSVQ